MDLKHELIHISGKNEVQTVVQWIGNHHERYQELWQHFRTGDLQLQNRAAWVLYWVVDKQPALVQQYIQEYVDLLATGDLRSETQTRAVARTVSMLELTEDQMGQLVDVCFTRMLSGTEAIAIKVHCMQILANIVEKIPELAGELQVAIESRMNNESAGFKSRARKVLKQLQKLAR